MELFSQSDNARAHRRRDGQVAISKSRRRLIVLVGIPVFLILALLLLWGSFCWGGWLGSSALVQQLFQCRCPPQSEQVRYRPFIVLAPACRKPQASALSDDGRWLVYHERVRQGRVILLDLETRRPQTLNFDPNTPVGVQFVRPTLLLVTRLQGALTRSFSLYDTTLHREVPLSSIYLWRETIPVDLHARLRDAETVLVMQSAILILVGQPNNYGAESIVIDAGAASWLPKLRAELDTLQVDYSLDYSFDAPIVTPDAVFSTDGQLSASTAGIANRATGAPVVPLGPYWSRFEPPWRPNSWVLGDRAVLYGRILTTVGGLGMWATLAEDWLVVPQPLLLLPVTPADARDPPP